MRILAGVAIALTLFLTAGAGARAQETLTAEPEAEVVVGPAGEEIGTEETGRARRIPAHTPEWTDLNNSDPGVTEADDEDAPASVTFGDGVRGSRPSPD